MIVFFWQLLSIMIVYWWYYIFNNRNISNFGGWNPNGGATASSGYQLAFEESVASASKKFSYSNNAAKLNYKMGLMTISGLNLLGIANVRQSQNNYFLMTDGSIANPYVVDLNSLNN